MKIFKFESGKVNLFLLSIVVSIFLFVLGYASVKAWGCPTQYQFQVLVDGTVQVKNDNSSGEDSQLAKVYLNSVYIPPVLTVPAVDKNTGWTTFGNISVPAAVYTWSVDGQTDTSCQNSGTNDNSPTQEDVCANVAGTQTSIPDGMQVDENHFCSCKEGYHKVNQEGQTVKFDSLSNFTCEPNASQSPSPEATPAPSSEGSSNSNPGAPVCNAAKPATPTIMSAVRNGTKETLTWGAVANATYYSIVYGSAPGYQYGVANIGNVTSYTVNALTPGVAYHFAVNAVNDCMPGDPGIPSGEGTGGQVLGASTMAGTGTFEENLSLVIMAIGGIITAFGIKNYKKAFKLAK